MALALLVMITMAVGFPTRGYANPQGGIVTAGQATITVRPSIVDVHQQSDKAVIDWRTFDIDNGETTQFHQPNAAAIALNRVHSSQASVINGALKANGNVIIVNQNGVLFGRNARVDVNGLLATTADIDNNKFMTQSKLNFDKPGNPNAAIINQGMITAKESGLVGFVAPSVENDGVIAARLGRVHLASGDKATVDFYGDGLMEVAVSDDVRKQLVKNTGTISADGGTVALTAAAGNRILASAIEVGGSVSTQTVNQRNGRIVIAGLTTKNHGVAGTVRIAGNLNASGKHVAQKGGRISVTGDKITVASTAKVDASGHAGGGDIKIGGALQGKGTTPTASLLVVEHGARILNNATYNGNGGNTVLWSDGATDFAGSVNNRGGLLGGNGGFVEVSGKNFLGFRGTVDTRAPQGLIGTLLLDPANLTISNALDSNVTAGTPFDSTGAATSNLNVGTLVGALGSSNVVLSTAAGTGGQGDITFTDAVSWNSGFSLTANADRHINVNAAITNAGSGGVFLNANTAGGIITVAAPISTLGNIALSAAQNILVNAALNSGGTLNLTATNNDIISNASGVINAGGALTTSSGRDTIFGANATAGGNVTVSAVRDITVAAARTLANGATNNMSLQAAGGSTAGTGNLNLNGNLSVGTGSLTLVSGVNGTRPSWTVTGTNLVRQGATFGAVNISGFLNLAINRALNSTGDIQLTGTNTGGAITIGAAVSGNNIAMNAANSVTLNSSVAATGTLGLSSTALDVIIGSAGSTSSTGTSTFTANRDVSISGPVTAGTLVATATTQDIIVAATGSINSTATPTLTSARDVTLNGSLTSGGNIAITAPRDITVGAGSTVTTGPAGSLSLQAAGGNTAGAGNLTLNGILNVGTGNLTLVSGIRTTRPSWTITGTNLLRQGATFGAVNISGFLNLAINRALNSSAGVTLTANNANGTITVGNTGSVTGTAITTNSALDTTINGVVDSSGALNVTARDLVVSTTGSTHSTGNTTLTLSRDFLLNGTVDSDAAFAGTFGQNIVMTNTGLLDVAGALSLSAGNITLGNVTSGGNVTVASTINLTTLAGTTITNGAGSNLSLQAAGGSTTGTGALTLNGNLNAGTGTLTLLSGINGTRPNWTATATNLLRQGATFGVVSISGFLNLVIDRDINSTGAVTLAASNTGGGNITVNNGRTISGTAITTNSNFDTIINGTINAGTTLAMTARDLTIGATGATNSVSTTTATVSNDLFLNGTLHSDAGFTEAVTRDIIMGTGGLLDTVGNLTLTGRNIVLGNVVTGGNLSVTATGTLNTLAATTITNGPTSAFTLTSTDVLTLNGILNVGSGALSLTSGATATRANWTMDGTNLLRQGATFGAITINGFMDTVINRDLDSSGAITITSFRDLTLGSTYTLTPASAVGGTLILRAANNVPTGSGALYLNGIINAGGGAVTLLSGTGGTLADYTMTASNFQRQNAAWNSVSITGFRDTTIDLDLNANAIAAGTITVAGFRDVTVSSGRNLTSGSSGGISLIAANNAVGNNGRLNLNGTLRSGTGALTLLTGINGSRPDLTLDGVGIQRISGAYGAITISGFNDTFVNDNLISNAGIFITTYRHLTLNAANTITTGTGGTGLLGLRAASGNIALDGWLYLNGVVNVGNAGAVTLVSGLNGGNRQNYTMTTTNMVPVNTNFGAMSITGFQDVTIDRNIAMTGANGINIATSRNLTIAAGRTVATGPTGALVLTAAGASPTGTGLLTLTGNIGAGSGGLTLTSGVNGVNRNDWTATTTNMIQQGANFGVVNISGFRDLTIDRDITGTGNATTGVTMLAYRDLTINSGRTVTSTAVGSLSLQAAGGLATGTGRLNINGNIGSGVGTLTLTSGTNVTRPIWTATATNLIRQGATFGTTSINGFDDFILDRPLNTTGNITFGAQNNRIILQDDVSTTGVATITFARPVVIGEGQTVNVTTVNRAISFGSTLDDTIGGADDNLVVNSGTAATTFTGAVNGIGLDATAAGFTITTNALGATRAMKDVSLVHTGAAVFNVPNVTARKILLRTTTATSNLNITAGRILTASDPGDAIVLAAGQNFVNPNGTSALVRTGGGRYITYSTRPADDSIGDLTYDERRFSCAFASAGTCALNPITGATPLVPATGNVFLYTMTPVVLIVTPVSIPDIIYGAAVPNLTNYAYVPFTQASGYLNADDFNNDIITGSINGQTNYTQGSSVGSYNISKLSGSLVSALGYDFVYQTLPIAFNVLPRHVSIDLTGTAGKVYDGNNTATLSGTNYTINNIYSGDVLTLGVSNSGVTYSDKNVGVGKTVTANGLALTGTPAGNYILDNSTAIAGVGTITPRALNVTGLSPHKVYDSTTGSSATLSDDRVLGDILTINYGTATFGNKNVANGKTVTINGITVGGTDAGNYTFNTSTTTTANITPAVLTIGASGINRIYNGTNVATVNLSDDRFGGDVLNLTYSSALFGDKNVANGKAVNVSGITITGADAGNYTFNTTAATAADITPRALNISATGINRVYNGTNIGTVTLGDDRVGGDVLTLGYGTALFGDKNVANGKTVTVSGVTLGGTDAGNYTFNTGTTTTANITPLALTITANGINRVYNGTNIGTVTLGDNRVGGDVLTLGYGTALFGNKNVANGKTVTVSGITLGGTDAGNYTFNTGTTTTANITPLALTITASGINRVYNGTNIGTVTLGDDRVGGDVLTLGYGTALFGDKNVANGKAVTVSGITLGGTDAGNYTFNTGTTTTANITPRALTITASGINRIYNGTNIGTVTLGDNRVGGDVLTTGYGTALFGDKNVANGKTVTVSGITLGGTDAGNYTFNTGTTTTANITPRALIISATGINRVYDGTNIGTVTLGDDRVGGDVLTTGYGAALFGDKNVANGKTVTVSGITLGGTDAGNYTFNTGTTTTANITPLALTITATGTNKVYDGNAVAGVNIGDNRVGGDVLTITFGSSLFSDKNVANGKTVTVSGIALAGTDAGNYTYNTSATSSANITPRALIVSAIGSNRIYNGTNLAAVSLSDDRVVGDVLTTGYGTALFGDKNVANGKTVTVSGITLGGTDAGNYTFNTSATTSANITPRALVVSANGSGKIYDGNANASVTIGDNRIGGDVLNITYASSLFPDKNAGLNRTITVSGINVTGADVGNYTFNTSATTTATISKASLTVTAANQNIIYGTIVPGTTLSYLGFVGSEGAGDLGTAPVAGSGVSGIVNAGTYSNNYTVGGGVDGNYSFVYVPGTLTVGKKTLNVTANTHTVTYGTVVPGGTLTYSGFITGEDATDLTSAPTVNSANGGILNAGTYSNNYTVSGGSSNNYNFNVFNGNLVVTKKDLNITANNRSITYGTAVPGGTLTYSGFISGEGVGDLDVAPSVNSAQTGVVNAGTYNANYTVSGGTDNNYTYHYAPGTLTVTQVGLNVTVGNQTVTYGTVVPGSSIVYTGFVNGDDLSDIDVLASINSGQSGIVNAGTYAGNYTATGAADGNYTFNYIAGNLIVTQKALNVTAGNRTITYGTVVPGSTLAYSGFISGEGVGDLNSAPTIVSGQSGVANAGSYIGNYAIVGGSADNYYFNFTPGNLIVSQRTLTVSALPQNIVYGTSVPVGSVTYTGFASGENVGDLDAVPVLSSANSGMVNAGTYVNNYTVAGGASGNYTFSYVPANLVVSKKTLSVVAPGRTITYGTVVPGATLTYSGFVAGQNAGFLDTAPVATSARNGIVNAGTYVNNYVASGGVDTNYSFVYTPGTLVVSRANVTVDANNLTRVYGNPNTFAGYTVSGLELGETIGSVTLSTNATTSAGGYWDAGSWNVVASGATGGTFNPANYNVSYSGGTMNISRRALNVSATGVNRTYNGSDLATVILTDNRAMGDALGISYADARFPDKNAGANRVITVSGIALGGADAGNYILVGGSTATTSATITPRVLVVTASGISKLYDGNANATVTLTDNRLGSDVLNVGYASALFPDATVGTNRSVTVSGLALTGIDAGNYSVVPSVTTTASIYSTLPPEPPVVEPPPTVIKVSQDNGSVVVNTTDDGIFATPSGSYELIYLPYDAPDENRWRNKPLRAGVGGVPIIEPTAWYGWVLADEDKEDATDI